MKKGEKTPAERRRHSVGTDPRADARRESAAARKAEYDALTTEEKIDRALTSRDDSKRELARLQKEER